MTKDTIAYADDDVEPISFLLRLRLPSLIIGLIFGIALSFAASRFEEVLKEHVVLVFFIPLVIYLGAAVGAQTQSIYTRDLKSGKASFKNYLFKETAIGLVFGIVFAVLTYFVAGWFFGAQHLGLAIAFSVLAIITVAPIVALIVTEIFQLEHWDPAVGSGPIGTVIQDTISIVIFGLITSAMLL